MIYALFHYIILALYRVYGLSANRILSILVTGPNRKRFKKGFYLNGITRIADMIILGGPILILLGQHFFVGLLDKISQVLRFGHHSLLPLIPFCWYLLCLCFCWWQLCSFFPFHNIPMRFEKHLVLKVILCFEFIPGFPGSIIWG